MFEYCVLATRDTISTKMGGVKRNLLIEEKLPAHLTAALKYLKRAYDYGATDSKAINKILRDTYNL